MVVEYEKDYLEELYNNGKSTNKKYRFQKSVVAKYQKRIDTLIAATRIEDLFVFNSLNFEALEHGYYSIRIDYHYRLVFKVRQEGNEPAIITICTVTDITNHYQ
jgi:proteic killer suppression protein